VDAGRRRREDREGEVVSALEELAQAVLDGRVSVRQSMPSRNSGTVTYSIKVEPKKEQGQ